MLSMKEVAKGLHANFHGPRGHGMANTCSYRACCQFRAYCTSRACANMNQYQYRQDMTKNI